MASPIVVDANRLISALLGGFALRLLQECHAQFLTTERTTREVRRYVPRISKRTNVPEASLHVAFELLPFDVVAIGEYSNHLSQAEVLIGNRNAGDVDLLALVLQRTCPIWTHDADFRSVPNLEVVSDQDLADRFMHPPQES